MGVGETEAGVVPGSFDGRSAGTDSVPIIKNYPGFGELVVGRSADIKVLVTALCMVNDPQVNQYLLDSKLRLEDRITKTKIFPREGMALPDGQFYKENK